MTELSFPDIAHHLPLQTEKRVSFVSGDQRKPNNIKKKGLSNGNDEGGENESKPHHETFEQGLPLTNRRDLRERPPMFCVDWPCAGRSRPRPPGVE